MAGAALVSAQNHVESPFIIVRIGDYTFGHCQASERNRMSSTFRITYPNYMQSLNVTKVNGSVNTYTLNMVYAITEHDDPNKLEKVFSSISNIREIVLSYGDWNSPTMTDISGNETLPFVFKEERAIITKLTTKVDMKSSKISYTINCTSNALPLTSGSFSFSARNAQPSSVIEELLNNNRYGLTDIFKGMKHSDFSNFIPHDDQTVSLDAKTGISVLDYISYLVSCMKWKGDKNSKLKTCCYFWAVYDDVSSKYGGTYFKITRVSANTNLSVSYNTYEVDIGYPTSANVLDFDVNNDDSWALLYNYSKKVQMPEYNYTIDDNGNLVQDDYSVLLASKSKYGITEETRDWWSKVTQFPITARLTLRGLLRPAMLMSYVKVNTYFYGHKHISSGLYIITKQEDTINASGYKTVLSLTRVGGDEEYA